MQEGREAMKIALLSFVAEPTDDPLGELVQSRLETIEGLQVVREKLRPDLPRLKGLLMAGLTDPRFDGIIVVANLPGGQNEALVQQIEASLQQIVPTWHMMVAQVLWPLVGSDLLWSHSCLGKTHQRLLVALTGEQAMIEPQLEHLLVPQLPRLLQWAGR